MTSKAIPFRRIIGGLCVAAFFALALNSLAPAQEKNAGYPQRVLLIRHAEKPPMDDKSVHLNAEGQERANALFNLFKPSSTRPEPFPTPEFIFAAKNSKKSHRSVETVTPLAARLKLAINSNYADEEYAKLAQEVLQSRKYAGKTVLICWHHGLASELAEKLKATDAPKHWKGTVFDRVWQITYDKASTTTFLDRPQQLLKMDSDK